MIKLLFFNRHFDAGGAERQLIELVRGLDKSVFDITVATFYSGGLLRSEADTIPGVRVITVGKQGRWDVVRFALRLWRITQAIKPDIVHGYLDLANVLALALGRLMGAKVVWGIRSSARDYSDYRWTLRASIEIQRRLARFANRIIFNSEAGKRDYLAQGFPAAACVVAPNGIDVERFRPDPEARRRVRAEWGIGEREKLIGLVARLDPAKDHGAFLQAAALLAVSHPDARFVCVGDSPGQTRDNLRALADRLGLNDKLVWAGIRPDMPATHNALDIATSSSISEGFSNTLAEAMACGVPCVATDVGDSALLIGNTGALVPPRNPDALAHGWSALFDRIDANPALGVAARQRIVDQFNTTILAQNTARILADLMDRS